MPLFTAIAYDTDRQLWQAYNRQMETLRPGDWCCFLDHDAVFTAREWYPTILKAIAQNPQAGLFTCMTNRIGRKQQIAAGCPAGHDMREHFAFGKALLAKHGSAVRDVTKDSVISGVVMVISHETWEQMGGFKYGRNGFFGVDNQAHRDVRRIGKRVCVLRGIYVYHWYRADGSTHPGMPRRKR